MSQPSSPPSCLYSGNAGFIETLYEAYLEKPDAVEPEWRRYFDELRHSDHGPIAEIPHGPVRARFLELSRTTRHGHGVQISGDGETVPAHKQVSVLQLINAYRFRGHRQADLDPLKQYQRPNVPELEPAFHDLDESDLDLEFNTGSLVAPDQLPDHWCGIHAYQ
jgi:2-oxoglutarate dehydrogenase E1 component